MPDGNPTNRQKAFPRIELRPEPALRSRRFAWQSVAATGLGGIALIGLAMWLLGSLLTPLPSDGDVASSPRTFDPPAKDRKRSPAPKSETPSAAEPKVDAKEGLREERVEDDGRLLWASPTSGPPISLGYLPLGGQIFVALRPADLGDHPEGEKFMDALGPWGAARRNWLEQVIGVPIAAMDQLILSFKTNERATLSVSLVVRVQPSQAGSAWSSRWEKATPHVHEGNEYYLADGWAYYVPSDGQNRVLAIATEAEIHQVIDAGRRAPPLRREMEYLLAESDSDRLVTILFSPPFLFADGKDVFQGRAAKLQERLDWFLSDGLPAASLSFHLDDNFFAEFRAYGHVEVPPHKLAQQLHERFNQVPDQVESFILSYHSHDYGRRILSRFPRMVQLLANYTRAGSEDGHALLRSYLPAIAGHNLLISLELALSESLVIQ